MEQIIGDGIELINKWKITGLLDECNSDTEELELSNLLEKALEVSDKDDKDLMSVIFPLVTRVYYTLRNANIDVARLCEIFALNKSVFYELPKYEEDAEAEYVAYCESLYIEEYNKSLS